MTQPGGDQNVSDPLEFPEDAPRVSFVISNTVSPDPNNTRPVGWSVGQRHPLIEKMSIIAIFIVPGGVEIYSVSPSDKTGIRNFIPMHWVRYVQETMPFLTFIDEYQGAISAALDEDDGDEDEEPEGIPATASPNGAPAP